MGKIATILEPQSKTEDYELSSPYQQPNRERLPRSTQLATFFSSIRLPVAILTGAAITAGTTYALVKHVQHLIATAGVDPDAAVWRQKAREDGYSRCYNGCNDCKDLNFAENACQKTAQAIVPGVECNGTKMWNWASRYPTECLDSLGLVFKAEALAEKKQTYRNQLAVIIFTILAGVLGAFAVYKVWLRLFPEPAMFGDRWPSHLQQGVLRTETKRRRSHKWPFLWRGAAVASLVNESRAYACWGYSNRANQYFSSPNSTISGVVHGWTSSCKMESYVCGQSCSSSSDGNGGTSTSCSVEWCERELEWQSPQWFVNYTSNRVKACGFEMSDSAVEEVNLRVGNPLLEKNWYVKISVNAFNISGVTDPAVLCLYDIGNH